MPENKKCDCIIGVYENQVHYDSYMVTLYESKLTNMNYWEVAEEYKFCPMCAKPIDWKALAESSGAKS